ncbi:LysR family transcriptional regulator [Pseudonocardia sp. MCCB 268]|nr:LysR family transcriptional regulator [Pseudonocardia cytotoxica]
MVLPSDAPARRPRLAAVSRSYGSVGSSRRQPFQPAASIRISAMERRLGLRLLERSPAGSKLTRTGRCSRSTPAT